MLLGLTLFGACVEPLEACLFDVPNTGSRIRHYRMRNRSLYEDIDYCTGCRRYGRRRVRCNPTILQGSLVLTSASE
jgi:hypothetical protein